MKYVVDIKTLQQKVAHCIISNAPSHVDTSHVKEIFLRNDMSTAPECVTVSTSYPGCRCNITVNFDCVLNDFPSKIAGERNSAVTVDWDSYCRTVNEGKSSLTIYNEMLQLAEKIEEVVKSAKSCNDLL